MRDEEDFVSSSLLTVVVVVVVVAVVVVVFDCSVVLLGDSSSSRSNDCLAYNVNIDEEKRDLKTEKMKSQNHEIMNFGIEINC